MTSQDLEACVIAVTPPPTTFPLPGWLCPSAPGLPWWSDTRAHSCCWTLARFLRPEALPSGSRTAEPLRSFRPPLGCHLLNLFYLQFHMLTPNTSRLQPCSFSSLALSSNTLNVLFTYLPCYLPLLLEYRHLCCSCSFHHCNSRIKNVPGTDIDSITSGRGRKG